jgi:hypothetical protein
MNRDSVLTVLVVFGFVAILVCLVALLVNGGGV